MRACLRDYAKDHPEILGEPGDTGKEADTAGLWRALTAAEFRHSTLNRLQMLNPKAMIDLADQASGLIYAGTLPNPLAHISPHIES
ncbi:hypothetical protein GP475_02530 [Corynebacterium poyangense]|uniref:Uncharacterized protein n=1 Tax=Corynebacterium poyangense TaxID=2684405 RepID=A0A7H0SM65_9CORY|nr:hypothetical protein [Corynebacterium poyangense]MBZ8176736.1 hypothetical protein [Corynebacterium poyangense]QNQ89640.1 hypothetical protein GP475_02530 [Corynebacterium poyangense]